jgi:hypothetical protein
MVVYIYCVAAAGNYISSQLEIVSARSWAAPIRVTGTVRKRQAVWPVPYVQNHICRVTLLQPDRRAVVLGQPSSLRPHHHTISQLIRVPVFNDDIYVLLCLGYLWQVRYLLK